MLSYTFFFAKALIAMFMQMKKASKRKVEAMRDIPNVFLLKGCTCSVAAACRPWCKLC